MSNLLTFVTLTVLALAGSHAASLKPTQFSLAEGQHPCGTILNTTSGILQYKPFETVERNERCVWILRVPRAVGYTFNMYNADFDNFDNNGLHIGGLDLGSHVPKNVNPQRIDTDYHVSGNVAILTFFSGTYSLGRGFSLYFSANVSSDSQVSNQSVSQIVSELEKDISHPLNTTGAGNYTNNELSVFVFTPEFTNNSTAYKNEIAFNQLGLEGFTCNDFLDIFTFDGSYPSFGWNTFGRFCGADTDVTFLGDDMVLLAFHSNSDKVGRGFELKYRRTAQAGKS